MKWIFPIIVILLIFSGCVPMSLLMGPEIQPKGTVKHAIGMDLLVGFNEAIVVPWTFQYLARMGLTDYVEASFRAALPSIFINSPSITLEGGAKFGIPGFSNIALLTSGGFFFLSKSGNNETLFEPYIRIAPIVGFKIMDWMIAAKLQLFVASEVGFIPGISVNNGRVYFDIDFPLVGGTTIPDGGLIGIGYAF